MTVVLIEGFDHEANGLPQIGPKGWFGSPFGYVTGRLAQTNRSAGIEVIANNPVYKFLPSSYSTIVVGFAFAWDLGSPIPLTLRGLGSQSMQIGLDFANRLTIKDKNGSVLATGTTIFMTDIWNYIEVKLTVGSTGTAEIHINGASEIAPVTGNFGNNNIDEIRMTWGGNANDRGWYDDMFALDTTGPAPRNDFLGDVRVETLYPDADGTHLDWAPNSGSPHFSRVNEAQIDGDTSYVSSTTPGNEDSYDFQPLLATGTIFGAQLNLGSRKNDANLRQVAPLIRQGGTDYIGTTQTLSGSYVFKSQIYNQDPTGSDWTTSSIDNDEYGIKLVM